MARFVSLLMTIIYILMIFITLLAIIIIFMGILIDWGRGIGIEILVTLLYPVLLLMTSLVSAILTHSFKKWRCRSRLVVWREDWKDKIPNKRYWWPPPLHWDESKWLRRSPLLLIMHFISLVIKSTSALQNSKAFFECRSKNKGEVPAWVIEAYVGIWLIYIGILACCVSTRPEWFSHPFVSRALLIILAYRAIHIVHGNLYYGLLRAMYTGKHRVHNPARNLALLMVSYIELCVVCAIAYLRLGDQFADPLTSFWDAFYLSAVTITTLGYGDIRPKCSGVRVIMGLEALSGLALLALAITRVLTLVPHPRVGSND